MLCARASARLLARLGDGAPVLFVDQPLFAGRDAGVGAAERARREGYERELEQQAERLGRRVGVAVALWRDCHRLERRRGEVSVPDAGVQVLGEAGGLSTLLYVNLEGVVRRLSSVEEGGEALVKGSDDGFLPLVGVKEGGRKTNVGGL